MERRSRRSLGRRQLVIYTVGIKTAFTSVDRFDTPQNELMHVIERYCLIDGTLAKVASDKYEKAGRAQTPI